MGNIALRRSTQIELRRPRFSCLFRAHTKFCKIRAFGRLVRRKNRFGEMPCQAEVFHEIREREFLSFYFYAPISDAKNRRDNAKAQNQDQFRAPRRAIRFWKRTP